MSTLSPAEAGRQDLDDSEGDTEEMQDAWQTSDELRGGDTYSSTWGFQYKRTSCNGRHHFLSHPHFIYMIIPYIHIQILKNYLKIFQIIQIIFYNFGSVQQL